MTDLPVTVHIESRGEFVAELVVWWTQDIGYRIRRGPATLVAEMGGLHFVGDVEARAVQELAWWAR